ncbi:MAG: flavodoxin domain-containing protein [Verrucomicrobiota bacterium]
MVSLPPDAPFTPEQIGWLNGYLAARKQSLGSAPATPAADLAPAPAAGPPVTILWGSQTGNSEGLAKKTAKTLTAKGHEVTITDMAAAEAETISKAENLLIITSTYGDGEPPDNAADLHSLLHSLLHSETAPRFEKTNFAVLGLGDSEYPDFNQCAIDFDTALEKLGAKRLCDRIESDVDYEEPFDHWLNLVGGALTKEPR